MPLIFKQAFNAFNLEFDKILEVQFKVFDWDFYAEVRTFGEDLMKYVMKVRTTQSELRDFNEEILAGTAHGAVLIAGRLSLLTANMLMQSILDKLTDDFPKFIGTKTNFWRYLIRLVPVYMNEVGCDYTKEFTVATACLIELNYNSIQLGQLNLVEHCHTFWSAMFLYFFGERFKGRDKSAFLEDLNLEENKNKCKGESAPLKIVLKVEEPKETKTEGESKRSRKKNKKRHK